MAAMESLRPDRSLLNAKFDGYKLSTQPLDVQSTSLAAPVNVVTLKDDVFSHLHVKAFGWTNHLVLDSWNEQDNETLLYFVDENYSVNQVTVKDNHVQGFNNVFQILPVEDNKAPHQLNAFVSFPCSSHAVASDGAGRLYILHTGNRQEQVEWELILIQKIDQPFSILHSNFEPNLKTLSCLLLSVTTDEESDSVHVKHTVVLTLLVFSAEIGDKGETKFVFEVQKEFQSRSVPLYGALEPSNKAILLASEKPFYLVTDKGKVSLDQGYEDIKPVSKEPDEVAKTNKEYAWTQDGGQITILYPLPAGMGKHDILFSVKTHSLKVSLKNGQTLLDGELYAPVESDSCTWIIEKQRLEISLEKIVSDLLWLDVIKGDERGQYRPNGENLEILDELLNTKTKETNTLFNQGELEECDSLPEDVLYIVRMGVKDGTVTHKTSLSTHQWLFTKVIKPTSPPAFCVRHDVDALIWQPHAHEDPGELNWTHTGTLNAFGFVHASKKEQKFTSCSPDMSYALVCDVRNHIFTYYQPSAEDAVHAEQKLVQLDDVGSDGIVGIQACKNMIFALAKNKLFLVSAF